MSELAAAIHEWLLARDETVATAESLTGGMLGASLTGTPGASATYRGGLVVYATDLKAELADVPLDLLAERGPVDADVAAALARGARTRLVATWGLAVTGVAGPDPQGEQPVGTVFAAVAGPVGQVRVGSARLDGDRDQVRAAAVELALRLLHDRLAERE